MEAFQYNIDSQIINENNKKSELEEFNGEYIIKNEYRSSFFSKMQFLTMYIDSDNNLSFTCIVVDSFFYKFETGIKLLKDMFDYIDFIFLNFPKDEDDYKKGVDENTFTENTFMNYSDIQNIIMICDFNTEHKRNYDFEMNLQKKWFEKIKPINTLLKFAPDLDKDYYTFMRGVIYWKIYDINQNNYYNYIVPSKRIISWDINDYMQICNYHNKYERNYPLYVLDSLGIQDNLTEFLKNDFDSMTEIYIIYMYLLRFKYYNEQIIYPKKLGEKEDKIEYVEIPIKIIKSLIKISDYIIKISNINQFNREKILFDEFKNKSSIKPNKKNSIIEINDYNEPSVENVKSNKKTKSVKNPISKKSSSSKSIKKKEEIIKEENNLDKNINTDKPKLKRPPIIKQTNTLKKVPIKKSSLSKK